MVYLPLNCLQPFKFKAMSHDILLQSQYTSLHINKMDNLGTNDGYTNDATIHAHFVEETDHETLFSIKRAWILIIVACSLLDLIFAFLPANISGTTLN